MTKFELDVADWLESLALGIDGWYGGKDKMTKFEKAKIPPEEVIRTAQSVARQWREGDSILRKFFADATEETIDAIALEEISRIQKNACNEVWKNDRYQVAIRRLADDMVHLSIKRIDRQPIHDWRDLQEIKNQLVGVECEGVELFPAESRRIDTANQYHLWCCSVPGNLFPFGFDEGRVVGNGTVAGSVQRPIEGLAEV